MNVVSLQDTIALLAQGVGVGFVLSFLFEKSHSSKISAARQRHG